MKHQITKDTYNEIRKITKAGAEINKKYIKEMQILENQVCKLLNIGKFEHAEKDWIFDMLHNECYSVKEVLDFLEISISK